MEPATDEKISFEKDLLMGKSLPTYHSRQNPSLSASGGRLTKMTFRRFFFAVLAVSFLSISLFSVTFGNGIFPRAASAISEVQRHIHEAFNEAEPSALLRYSADTINPDVDREARNVLETAPKHDSEVTQAVVELLKRQNSPLNDTTTSHTTMTTEPSSTSTSLPITSTTGSVTTTSSMSSTALTDNSSTSVTTSSTTTIITTSQTSTADTSSSSPSSSSTTESPSSTTTPSSTTQDSSKSTTSSPTPTKSITSLHVYTSTEGGAVVTVTELTVVPAPVAAKTDAGSSQTLSASLQPNGAITKNPSMKVILSALFTLLLARL